VNGECTSIDQLVRTRWKIQQDRMLRLIDDLVGEFPSWDDELLCWLISSLQSSATERPFDPRDPWSALLRLMSWQPDQPIVTLRWAFFTGRRGELVTTGGQRYEMTIQADETRTERRVIVAHELAHLRLGHLEQMMAIDGTMDDVPLSLIRRQEHEADRWAFEHYDVSPTILEGTDYSKLGRP
jgi:hypothetical protein